MSDERAQSEREPNAARVLYERAMWLAETNPLGSETDTWLPPLLLVLSELHRDLRHIYMRLDDIACAAEEHAGVTRNEWAQEESWPDERSEAEE